MERIDQSITLWLNAISPAWLDSFWVFMSQIKVWIPLYVAVAALLIWRLGWKKGLVAVACVAAAFAAEEQVNNLIKAAVGRIRPCNDPDMLAAGLRVLETGGGWSFPSGHAHNSFGFAMSTSMCLKTDEKANWKWYTGFIFVWAALVAISRIMVGKHFLGDVITGALLGTVISFFFAWLSFIIGRFIDKKAAKGTSE